MLARSLIREVAPVGMADSPSANSAAQAVPNTLAEVTPDILCSPLRSSLGPARHSHDGDPAVNPCEPRAMPLRERSRLTSLNTLLRRSEERRVGKEGRSRWSPYH